MLNMARARSLQAPSEDRRYPNLTLSSLVYPPTITSSSHVSSLIGCIGASPHADASALNCISSLPPLCPIASHSHSPFPLLIVQCPYSAHFPTLRSPPLCTSNFLSSAPPAGGYKHALLVQNPLASDHVSIISSTLQASIPSVLCYNQTSTFRIAHQAHLAHNVDLDEKYLHHTVVPPRTLHPNIRPHSHHISRMARQQSTT